MTTPGPAMFGVTEAADLTGLTPRHLRDLARRREIPHRRIGSLVRFTRDDCDAIVAQFAVVPVSLAAPKRRAS